MTSIYELGIKCIFKMYYNDNLKLKLKYRYSLVISRTTLSPVWRPCKPLKNIATGDSSPACSTKINQAKTKSKILVFQVFFCCSPVFHIYDPPIHTNIQSELSVLFLKVGGVDSFWKLIYPYQRSKESNHSPMQRADRCSAMLFPM